MDHMLFDNVVNETFLKKNLFESFIRTFTQYFSIFKRDLDLDDNC